MDSSAFKILNSKYILLKKIGTGGSCKVFVAKYLNSDEDLYFAVKILKSTYKDSNYNDVEMQNLSQMSHPNIIKLVEGGKGSVLKPNGKKKSVKFLVLELACHGELFDYIYYPKVGLGEKIARVIFIQLIEALECCHSANVAHRDLKTENLMMDHEWKLKMADFGFSKVISGSKMKTFLGTYQYMAPELLARQAYNGKQADIFSTGVILYILVTGVPPFKLAKKTDPWYKNFCSGSLDDYWKTMSTYTGVVTEEFKNLVTAILSVNPAERPTASEILQHPWVINAELPTFEEYISDFESRRKIVRQAKEKEAQTKARQQGGTGVYKDEDNHTELFKGEFFVANEPELTDKPGHIIKLTGPNYLDHLNYLSSYFLNNPKVEEVKPHKENAKFKIMYKSLEEDSEFLLETEQLVIQVELKRIDDENFLAEFIKVEGDKYVFYDEFKIISSDLAL